MAELSWVPAAPHPGETSTRLQDTAPWVEKVWALTQEWMLVCYHANMLPVMLDWDIKNAPGSHVPLKATTGSPGCLSEGQHAGRLGDNWLLPRKFSAPPRTRHRSRGHSIRSADIEQGGLSSSCWSGWLAIAGVNHSNTDQNRYEPQQKGRRGLTRWTPFRFNTMKRIPLYPDASQSLRVNFESKSIFTPKSKPWIQKGPSFICWRIKHFLQSAEMIRRMSRAKLRWVTTQFLTSVLLIL